MKASYRWILDHLAGYEGSADEMAARLTFSGTEVESVTAVGNDFVFTLGVTSNRGDSLCHVGLARDLSAVTGRPLVIPTASRPPTDRRPTRTIGVRVEDSVGCPRYTARLIEGVKIGPSPHWLAERLTAVGIRPVNNVVDVTNFVMLERNQPLHAFDADRIVGDHLTVRRARDGEPFTALNGREFALTAEDLVIADSSGVLALAGVMGGLTSEVRSQTTRILLEAACFEPVVVRKSVRRHGLRSDSSHRFERRIDRAAVAAASDRAAEMIAALAGGTISSDWHDEGSAGAPGAPIRFRLAQIQRVIGISVAPHRVREILQRLGCAVTSGGSDEVLEVTSPSWRHDLTREIDLIEEVIRCHGLDQVPAESALRVAVPRTSESWVLRDRLKDWMVGSAAYETVTPDFVRDGADASCAFLREAAALVVENPVRAGEGTLRRSLLPSLLTVRRHNQDRGDGACRLFEITNLHFRAGDGIAPLQVPVLGVLLDGDFRDGKGLIEVLAERLGLRCSFEACTTAFLDPAGRARLTVERKTVGFAGYPSRELRREHGLELRPMYLELDLGALLELSRETKEFAGLPRYPAATRDLALVLDESVTYGRLEASIRANAGDHLEAIELFDVFRGPKIGHGRKSLALRLTLRSATGTLDASEITGVVDAVAAGAARDLGGEWRRS